MGRSGCSPPCPQTPCPLADYKFRHDDIDLKVTMFGNAAPTTVPGLRLCQVVNGASIFWSILDLYRNIVPKSHRKVEAGTWWQNYRRRLAPLFEEHADFNVKAHFRQSQATVQAKDHDKDEPHRVVQKPALWLCCEA